jgi:hypothetical protein
VCIDVVLEDGNGITDRVVMWDDPDFESDDASLIAAVYSQGLRQCYPSRDITSIEVWQGRRQTRETVSFQEAQAELGRADAIRQGLT